MLRDNNMGIKLKKNLPSTTEENIKKPLTIFLEKIIQNKTLHTRWLNTLAFMEHIGSRKIIKSQNSFTLDIMLLQHISEEARHAFYFKKLAHNLSPKDCINFEENYLIKGDKSEQYFQDIDHKVQEDLVNYPAFSDNKKSNINQNPLTENNLINKKQSAVNDSLDLEKKTPYSSINSLLNYLYTTWLIEERAVMLYEEYNKILEQKNMSFNLNIILKEEDHHLKTVLEIIQKKDLDFIDRSDRLFKYENSRFIQLLKEWQSV